MNLLMEKEALGNIKKDITSISINIQIAQMVITITIPILPLTTILIETEKAIKKNLLLPQSQHRNLPLLSLPPLLLLAPKRLP